MTAGAGPIGVETVVQHGGDQDAVTVNVDVARSRPAPGEVHCISSLYFVTTRTERNPRCGCRRRRRRHSWCRRRRWGGSRSYSRCGRWSASQADVHVCRLAIGDIKVSGRSSNSRFRDRVGMCSGRQRGIVSAISNRSAIRLPIDRDRGVSHRRAPTTEGYGEVRSPFLRRGALGEFEVADARTPVKAGSGRVVFVGVVEGAIVHRINGDIAVIAPAIGGAGLATGAIKKMLFT